MHGPSRRSSQCSAMHLGSYGVMAQTVEGGLAGIGRDGFQGLAKPKLGSEAARETVKPVAKQVQLDLSASILGQATRQRPCPRELSVLRLGKSQRERIVRAHHGWTTMR